MIKLGIRVANSINSGRGHFERCFSISNNINQKIIWLLDYKNKIFEDRVLKKDQIFYENDINELKLAKSLINSGKINFLLIDSYNLNIKDIIYITKKIPVCSFQDKNNLLPVQMVICPHPIVFKIKKNTISLNGPRYAPITNTLVKNKKTYKGSKINILVSMGAYDSLGVTLNVLKAIDKIIIDKKLQIQITIVLAKGSPILEEVVIFIKNKINFKLVLDVKDMSEIYNDNNIAIGAPGVSHLERMYMGLPTILIAQNKIHKILIEKWDNLGCAIKAKNSVNDIKKNILYLIENKNLRKELIRNGRKSVDGKGSLRIAKSILKFNKKYD